MGTNGARKLDQSIFEIRVFARILIQHDMAGCCVRLSGTPQVVEERPRRTTVAKKKRNELTKKHSIINTISAVKYW